MCFKRLLLAISIALLPACSLKLNDKVTKNVAAVNMGSGCLSRAGDVLDRFAKGALEEPEHDAFYACLDRALSTFANHADGKSKEHFEPQELASFLSKYFLKGTPIQPALLREAMVLKRAFVGGSPDQISRVEIRRIIQLFGVLKTSTALIRPVMPFQVKSFVARKYTAEQFEEALRLFEQSFTIFSDQIKNEQQAYSFDHLASLIRELRVFLYKDSVPADHWTTTLLKMSEVIRPAKVIFVSSPRDEISAQDWPKLFRLAPRYYSAFLRGDFYFQTALSSFSAEGLQRIERTYAHFVDIFENVIEQRHGQAITSTEIDDLIQALHAQEMLGCKPETARAFVKAAFGRLLGGGAAADSFSVTKHSLNRFKENFRFGLEGLHAIEALYRGRVEQNGAGGLMTREEIENASDEQLVGFTFLKNALSREAVLGVKSTPGNIRTVFPEKSFVVNIPHRGSVGQFSMYHMIRMHALRSVNRLLFQAYGDASKQEISESQLDHFMSDLFPILEELQYVSASMRATVGKRLSEASLFLYSSDGHKGLNATEALELQALLISTLKYAPEVHMALFKTGMKTCEPLQKREMEKELARAREQDPEKKLKAQKEKLNEKPLIPASCYKTDFIQNAKQIWNYIPGLADFMGSKTAQEQEALFDRMANFLRKGRPKAEDFALADTQAFILLPYYIELLFSRFDANGDGYLDNAEAVHAYPVFQPFLAIKAGEKGYTDDKTHRAIFNFLLAYRQLPTDDTWNFVVRRYLLGDRAFRVDRGQVVEIFDKLMSL